MNRRNLLKGGAITAGVAALGGFQISCKPKSLDSWALIIETDFRDFKPLLPQLGLSQAVIDKIGDWLDKGINILHQFSADYRNGDFANAVALFNSLGEIVASIANEFNVLDNKIVKLILVSIQVARIAIASLLSEQATASSEAMKAVRGAKASDTAEIRKLAAVNVDKLLKAVQ